MSSQEGKNVSTFTQEELEHEIANAMSRTAVLEMTIEHMTGKEVKES